jgi:hypothetical protein
VHGVGGIGTGEFVNALEAIGEGPDAETETASRLGRDASGVELHGQGVDERLGPATGGPQGAQGLPDQIGHGLPVAGQHRIDQEIGGAQYGGIEFESVREVEGVEGFLVGVDDAAGAARLHDDGRITALGHGAQFRAAGILAKQHRLRRLSERLHAKADQYQRLLDGGAPDPALTGKHAVLTDEIRHVSDRRSNLNDALAWASARWAVDQAIAAGATVIYLEDLRSMEAKGMGRTMNTRMSQAVRGQIADRMRHLAAETGIAVVTVPAPGTSKHCPQCLTPLRHRKAPDRPAKPGWKWAICPDRNGCGWQGDRDQGAWLRIAARGLAHQVKTVIDRTSGTMVIRSVVDNLEAKAVVTPTTMISRDRSKTGPTGHQATRPAPRRRRAPPPPAPRGRRASVRRDTHQRAGPGCPAQPTGTRT